MTPTIEPSEIEKRLMEHREVAEHIHFEYPEQEDMPNVSLELWNSDEQESTEYRLQCLEDFLFLPYITDDFESHVGDGGRKQWVKDMMDDYGWFKKLYTDYYKKNALALTQISGLNLIMQNLPYGYEGTNKETLSELTEGIMAMIPSSPREYDQLGSNERKIDLVKGIKSKVYRLMEFLSNQN
jgi:hypothetical protein